MEINSNTILLGIQILLVLFAFLKYRSDIRKLLNDREKEIKRQAEHDTNIQRDIKEINGHIADIKADIGNGTGLKSSMQSMKRTCAATRSVVLNKLGINPDSIKDG